MILKTMNAKAKIVIVIAVLTVAVAVYAQTKIRFTSFQKLVTLATTPERITSTNLQVTTATLRAYKDRTTVNVATCYVGTTSANDTQLFPITSGGEIVLGPLPNGQKFDLKDIYIDVGNDGDGVIVTYY